jgi:outer membrane protein
MFLRRDILYKRIPALFLLMVLVLFPQQGIAQGSGAALQFDLKKAMELAVAQNQDTALAQLNVEAKRMACREAEAAARDLPASIVTTYPLALQKYVAPRVAAMDLVLAQRNAELAEKNIRLLTERQFYTLLKARQEVALKEAALTRSKELLTQVKEKLRVGVGTRMEVLAQEATLTQAEAALENAKAQAENAALDLKRTLNLNLDQKIDLVGDFDPSAPEAISLETVTKDALATSLAVLAAREKMVTAEIIFQQAKKFYTPNVFTYRESNYNLEVAKVNIAKTEAEIRAGVLKDYNKLTAAASGITALAKGVEQAKEALRLTKMRYEVGMATSLEVEQVADRLAEIELQLLAARYDYQLFLTKFHYRLFDSASAAASA